MSNDEILEGIKSGRFYDFVAKNYYKMDKEQLRDIILELLAQFNGLQYERILAELKQALIDYRCWQE